MIKRIIAAIAICLFSITTIQAQAKDEVAVAAAVEQLRKAMIDGDSSALAKLTADDLNYGHSHGNVQGKAAFISGIVSGQSNFETIDLTEQTIKVNGDVAVVRHQLTAKTMDNGKPGDVHLGILLVWQKRKGEWKLLARQAVKI